jgi:hypothetical protein
MSETNVVPVAVHKVVDCVGSLPGVAVIGHFAVAQDVRKVTHKVMGKTLFLD